MISIYIHIPFCAQKCPYCSFYSFFLNPEIKDKFISDYIEALYKEVAQTALHIKDKEIKTIYIGGGSPNILTPEQLTGIVDYIGQHFDTSEVLELSIELNPYPTQEIYDLVLYFRKHFRHWPRLRFSFGIQTFDNQILQDTGRPVTFAGISEILRGLRTLKQDNMIFNFDFIAFGKFGETRKGEAQLWDPGKIEFFERFANSKFADSFSLYTLELFPGSAWKSKTPDQAISGTYYGSDDDIFAEYSYLKDILLDAGYTRYEASNFCKIGTSSIHNRTYWNMEPYIGFGPSASSFMPITTLDNEYIQNLVPNIDNNIQAFRWTNTNNLADYIKGNTIDNNKIEPMTPKDFLIESFFLRIRTDQGIANINEYSSILVPNYKELILKYKEEGFIITNPEKIILSDAGLDVSNTIITELLQEI